RGEIREQQPPSAQTGQPKPASFVSVDIRGENIIIDDKLLKALPSKPQEVANAFHPTGFVDVQAIIRRDGRSRQFSNRFTIGSHQASLRYKVFPYPLENVMGTLEVQPHYWEFHDFRGTHKGGDFRGRGRSIPTPEGDRIEVSIEGTNLL